MPKLILYSLQRCPYAMRARMALLIARQDFMLRAIVTKDKPPEMLEVSPKGTVPILLFEDGKVIDESLDIMIWALQQNDPEDLLYKENPEALSEMLKIIERNDKELRPTLMAYKCAKRFHEENYVDFRAECAIFMEELEGRLANQDFLFGDRLSLLDLALLPSVRQFANVEKKWFRGLNYTNLSTWLEKQVDSKLFFKTMKKFPLWLESGEEYLFSWDEL